MTERQAQWLREKIVEIVADPTKWLDAQDVNNCDDDDKLMYLTGFAERERAEQTEEKRQKLNRWLVEHDMEPDKPAHMTFANEILKLKAWQDEHAEYYPKALSLLRQDIVDLQRTVEALDVILAEHKARMDNLAGLPTV